MCLLEAKQTPACVGDLSKKPTIGDKTEPLRFQKVGPKSRQPRVTWHVYLVAPFGTRKCQSQHVLLHSKEYGDHPTKNK